MLDAKSDNVFLSIINNSLSSSLIIISPNGRLCCSTIIFLKLSVFLLLMHKSYNDFSL